MKKNIILGISLLIISIILIIYKSQGSFIEGKVIDITYNKSKEYSSSILISKDNEPFIVYFKDTDIGEIKLNDTVKIKTSGEIRESYPAQVDGFSIKVISNKSQKIYGEFDPSIVDNIKTIVFTSSYYEEEVSYKNKFKTKVLKDENEFDEFISTRNIVIPKNIDINKLFDDNIAVISYTNMTSSGIVDFLGLYKEDNNMYIYIKINSGQVVTTDIVTRAVISFVSKDYIFNNFETLSKYTIE